MDTKSDYHYCHTHNIGYIGVCKECEIVKRDFNTSVLAKQFKKVEEEVDIADTKQIDMNEKIGKAHTQREEFDLTQIPLSALKRVGKIFVEGAKQYPSGDGRTSTWRNGVGDKTYQLERANHALKHLLVYIHMLETGEYIGEMKEVSKAIGESTWDDPLGQRDTAKVVEDDLAKVLWFCVTQCEIERLESLSKGV